MGKRQRGIGLLALLCLVSGCASAQYRPAKLPGQGLAPAPSTESSPPEISVGSGVEITLCTGEQIVGVVTEFGDSVVVVKESSAYGAPPTRVAKRDIASVKMQYADSSEKALAFVAIGAAIAAIVWLVSTTGELTAN